MFGKLLAFRTRRQPYMVRVSYRYEMRSALTFPLAASLAEGSFTGVVAAKYFRGSPLLIAVITAAPMFGNLMAMVWSELAKTRPKVRLVNLAQLGVISMIAAAALTAWLPLRLGGWMFGLLIILARLLAAGITTIRSEIWRSNYPRAIRGQILGRILIVGTFVLAFATLAGAEWLDRNPRSFVYLYPGAAMLGAIGIWQFSHIRIRGEGQHLRRIRQRGATDGSPVAAKRGFRAFFLDAFKILREDKAFRDYQRYQFLSGASFMFFGPGLLYMVSREMTDPTRQYLLATFVLQIVPMLITLVCTPMWAPLFDRMDILTFRVYQTSTSVLGQALIFIGAIYGLRYCNHPGLTIGLGIVALGQVMLGVSNAGSNLAWDLGHCDFASDEKATTYMGVHVMLTGLRGCVAPFLGAWAFQVAFIGRYVFAISTLMCAVALAGFWHLSQTVRLQRHRETTGQAAVAAA